MPRNRRPSTAPLDDETHDDRPRAEAPPAQLREWAERKSAEAEAANARCASLQREVVALTDEAVDLRLENACLRAGLDPDSPGVKLLLAQFSGPAEPGALGAAWQELTANVLSQNFASGRSLSQLAESIEPDADDPTDEERAAAAAARALHRSPA